MHRTLDHDQFHGFIHAKPGSKPFRYAIPTGKGIGSAPVVVDGHVYFGADEGYFYVLAPDGTVLPDALVLVVGAGVAGLAAIGAAGSLGAIVRATDPRPEVADQVRSLGGCVCVCV